MMINPIKRIINEELGISRAIEPWVTLFYNRIISELKRVIYAPDTDWNTHTGENSETGEEMKVREIDFKIISDLESMGVIVKSDVYRGLPIFNSTLNITLIIAPKKFIKNTVGDASFRQGSKLLKLPSGVKMLKNVSMEYHFDLSDEIFNNKNKFNEYIDSNVKFTLRQVIHHELTHLYEVYMVKLRGGNEFNRVVGVSAAEKMGSARLPFLEILYHLIYLQLPHEISARVKETYQELKDLGVHSADDFKEKLGNTRAWKEASYLIKFSPTNYLNRVEIPADLAPEGDEEAREQILNMVPKYWEEDFKEYAIAAKEFFDADVKPLDKRHTRDFRTFLSYWDKRFKENGLTLRKKLIRLYALFR